MQTANYAKSLKDLVETLEKMLKQTSYAENEWRQRHNDLASLEVTIKKREEMVAKLDREIQTRLPQFEAGMAQKRKDLMKQELELLEKHKVADTLKANAKRELEKAENLRLMLESRLRQVESVASAQKVSTVYRTPKIEEVRESEPEAEVAVAESASKRRGRPKKGEE